MRAEEIRKAIETENPQRLIKCQKQMQEKYYSNKEEYISAFTETMDKMFEKCLEKQEKGKDCTKYIDIWSTRLSVATGDYKYIIRLYDASYYYDKEYIEVKWYPTYRKEFIEADKIYYEKYIMSKIIQAKKYDVKDFLREYLYENYIKPMPEEIVESMERIGLLESFLKMKKDNIVRISYGEMMEKNKWEKEFSEKCAVR